MSPKHSKRSEVTASHPRRGEAARPSLWLGVGFLTLLVLAALAWWMLRQPSGPSIASNEPHAAPLTSTFPSAASTNQIRHLEGRWLRTDGDYVIEVRYAGSDGRVEASYFNPSPIYVSRAESRRDGAQLKLLVELQDVGYPGCNYVLTYDPTNDRLRGVYFQAALQESYDVEFEKLR